MAQGTGRGSRTRDGILDDGEQAFYEGRYAEALERFDEALEREDADADAHYLRARALYYLERFEDAESAYDRALDIVPDFAPALIHKAELMVRVFDSPEQAVGLLDELGRQKLQPEDQIDASFVRGIALMEMGDYWNAHEPLNRAVRGDAEWIEALTERGICRYYLWRFVDARRDLERAVQLDPGDAEAHQYLGMCLERLQEPQLATRAFQRAAELDPNAFQPPFRMSREDFEQAAFDAVHDLPEDFQMRFDNVSFAVEDLPAKDQGLQPDTLGMFAGAPLTERSHFDIASMPCHIRLFQKNLERIAPDLHTLKDEIGRTVLHEVGHFFGLNEDDMVRLQIH